jgi:hypothetical protein
MATKIKTLSVKFDRKPVIANMDFNKIKMSSAQASNDLSKLVKQLSNEIIKTLPKKDGEVDFEISLIISGVVDSESNIK